MYTVIAPFTQSTHETSVLASTRQEAFASPFSNSIMGDKLQNFDPDISNILAMTMEKNQSGAANRFNMAKCTNLVRPFGQQVEQDMENEDYSQMPSSARNGQ